MGLGNCATRGIDTTLPTCLDVFEESCGHITACLLGVVHNVSFVHHIPLTVRDEFFELVSQQLAADIKPSHMSGGDHLMQFIELTSSRHTIVFDCS
jgi:hypothetical protein